MLRTALFTALILTVSAPPLQPQDQPAVRVTTRLVQTNVIVQDKRGEPVPNLRKDDFIVTEDGREQKVAVFAMESNRPVPGAPAPVRLPPDTYTNTFDYRTGTPTSITAILIDMLNTEFQDQAYAKAQVVKFLQQIQPQDRVAIYALGRNLRVLHDFSNSTESLLRVLARHRGESSAPPEASVVEDTDTGDAQMDALLNGMNERVAEFYIERRVETTLAALESIANHLSRLPGRKNLIWVSGSFPFHYGLDSPDISADRKVFNDEVSRTTRVVTDANIAIYPVDARGLMTPAQINPSMSATRRGSTNIQRAIANDARARSRVMATQDSMMELAERTGGRAFLNTNDIRGSIRRALDDSRITYLVGYYPANPNWDGKFRKIKVEVRQKGLLVRARQGYFAIADEQLTDAQRGLVAGAVASSPLDATGIALTVHVVPPESKSGTLKLETTIKTSDVTLQQQQDHWIGNVYFAFIEQDHEGKQVYNNAENLNFRLVQSRYDEMVKNGMVITGELPLKPGAETVRLVIRDEASGNIGSIRIPVPNQ